jgi:hypothetical protein
MINKTEKNKISNFLIIMNSDNEACTNIDALEKCNIKSNDLMVFTTLNLPQQQKDNSEKNLSPNTFPPR